MTYTRRRPASSSGTSAGTRTRKPVHRSASASEATRGPRRARIGRSNGTLRTASRCAWISASRTACAAARSPRPWPHRPQLLEQRGRVGPGRRGRRRWRGRMPVLRQARARRRAAPDEPRARTRARRGRAASRRAAAGRRAPRQSRDKTARRRTAREECGIAPLEAPHHVRIAWRRSFRTSASSGSSPLCAAPPAPSSAGAHAHAPRGGGATAPH